MDSATTYCSHFLRRSIKRRTRKPLSFACSLTVFYIQQENTFASLSIFVRRVLDGNGASSNARQYEI